MRSRTIILILAGVLLVNALIVIGVLGWFRAKAPPLAQSVGAETSAAAMPDSIVETVKTEAGAALALPDATATWAEFAVPHDGEAVPRRFRASGRCGPVPAGSRLMLVVDSGRSIFSPKLPPLVVDGETWSGTANEFGAPSGGTFSLCVFLVSEEAVGMIAEWHAQGKAIGKWPPFRGAVPGGVSLARIKLRVASK